MLRRWSKVASPVKAGSQVGVARQQASRPIETLWGTPALEEEVSTDGNLQEEHTQQEGQIRRWEILKTNLL